VFVSAKKTPRPIATDFAPGKLEVSAGHHWSFRAWFTNHESTRPCKCAVLRDLSHGNVSIAMVADGIFSPCFIEIRYADESFVHADDALQPYENVRF
jgi:hypothetical protein